jgi:uncharacterized membrane protein
MAVIEHTAHPGMMMDGAMPWTSNQLSIIDSVEAGMERTSNSLVTWTQIVYALHAFSLLTGIIGTATIVGAFLTGWPSIIAVILNYIKRSEARGTWLESHFRWQIRTFWFGLLWISLCLIFILVTFGIGVLVAWIPMALVGLWFVYRIVRGWVTLGDGRPMYV